MNILVINAGSSSLKYQLIDMDNESLIAKGNAERIGIAGSNLQHRPTGKDSVVIEKPMANHIDAIKMVLDALVDPQHGVIADMSEIHAVGHRVVHGGERFASSVVIDETVMDAIRDNISLAPLHNPANIMGIEACRAVMPATPMVAVFDTAFHQTMPPKAYLYGLPYDLYTRLKVRRYGFHGTSHRYVSQEVARVMGKDAQSLKVVTCHLGNGGSVTAVDGGKSVDTSMGMTPLEGIIMGTRSGSLDPAILEFVMKQDDLTIDDVMAILNKKSGLLGLSGVGSDMRDVTGAAREGNERARQALEAFTYSVRKYIGAYAAAMNGMDCIVMTAGIGENVAIVRKMVLENLEWLGVELDNDANENGKGDRLISKPTSRVKVYVISTNEELMIARDTLELVGK